MRRLYFCRRHFVFVRSFVTNAYATTITPFSIPEDGQHYCHFDGNAPDLLPESTCYLNKDDFLYIDLQAQLPHYDAGIRFPSASPQE